MKLKRRLGILLLAAVALASYIALLNEYNNLAAKYKRLSFDYSSLKETFDRPLKSRKTPTPQELVAWLAEDETNEMVYDKPDFTCGDYAVMLALHAKAKRWDMGIVAVWGRVVGSQTTFGHVFNAIITTDGLYYIEPQTDEVWCYENHEEIKIGKIYEFPGDTSVRIEDVLIILWYCRDESRRITK